MTKFIKISNNFYRHELLVSDTFPAMVQGITPSPKEFNNAVLLAQSLWQPARTQFDTPFKVLSWGRTPELNKKIGGSGDSDHLYFSAADMSMDGINEVFLWMYYQNLPYRQLILYPDQKFIHGSINIPGRTHKHEALIKYKAEDTYFTFKGGRIAKP